MRGNKSCNTYNMCVYEHEHTLKYVIPNLGKGLVGRKESERDEEIREGWG